jgi:hypothetical protein
MTYRRELEKQMMEKKDRDSKDKIARESFEKQKDTEIYDPFGKGGCGAPVRDQFGNLVADLKQMRRINENRLSNTSPLSQQHNKDVPKDSPKEGTQSPLATHSPRTTILTYDKDDEDKKIATQESYRDYLQRQVKEKEEMKRKEKEKLKLEEQKELEQLERDRKRLQEEYQEEVERQRRKEEEARRKNEEIKNQAEIKRQIAIMQQEQEMLRDETEMKALAEKRLDAIGQLSPSPAQSRAASPPIPTLRRKMKQFTEAPPRTPDGPEHSNFRSSSPPVPTLRKKQARSQQHDPSQAESADRAAASSHQVVPHVTLDSRPHLQKSEEAVQNTYTQQPPPPQPQEAGGDLHVQHPPDTHGGQEFVSTGPSRPQMSSEADQNALLKQLGAIRMHLQAELAKQTGHQLEESDIFEKAKQQKPKIAVPKVPKSKDSATRSALRDFTRVKLESSRNRDFLEDFPENPDTVSMMEEQQQALLHHQRNLLQRAKVKQRRQYEELDSPMLSGDTSQVSRYPFADSAGSSHHQPARRQRDSGDRIPSPGGRSKFSVNTLDVEDMAVRNEARMRRLEAILNSGSVSAHAQSDTDSLPSFSGNNFPPSATARPEGRGRVSRHSEHSLDCDTTHLPV